MFTRLRHSRSLVLVLVGVLVLAFGATTASADDEEIVDVSKKMGEIQKKIDDLRATGRWARRGELSAAAVCDDKTSAQVFAPWGDTADYVPAPQGDVEDISAWDVDNDVSLVDQNAPFSHGSHSILLSEGGEAVSPVMCVSTSHPTIRFFAANTGSPDSTLEVEVIYEDLNGHRKKLKIARLRGSQDWRPTLVVPIHVNRLAAASEDGLTAVAFKFKAKDVKSKGRGWMLDDLYVDPWKSW
jgi:hypothetical protein